MNYKAYEIKQTVVQEGDASQLDKYCKNGKIKRRNCEYCGAVIFEVTQYGHWVELNHHSCNTGYWTWINI